MECCRIIKTIRQFFIITIGYKLKAKSLFEFKQTL